MKKFILLIIITISPLFYLLYCNQSKSGDSFNANPKVVLNISGEHQELFTLINKKTYLDKEIQALFLKMNKHGNELCKMIYRLIKFNPKITGNFINPRKIQTFKRKVYKSSFQSLVAGCWNFFVLNDAWTNRDFRLVKKLYK